jgi:hypothetical protein
MAEGTVWEQQWNRVGRWFSRFRETADAPWEQQWKRLGRWFSRFRKTAEGRDHDRESDFYQDEAYAFFQNCFHLKDWLKNDDASSAAASDVEDFISQSPSLSLCADLANGSKHLKLTTHRVDADTKLGRRHFDLTLGGGVPRIAAKYEVEAAGSKHDAFKLASACMAEWETYLKAKGLISEP